MELILANWSTPSDYDCFCDDHGIESVVDLAYPQGSVYKNLNDAKADCLKDVTSFYECQDEEMALLVDATWRDNGDNQHNLINGDYLLAVLVARKVEV